MLHKTGTLLSVTQDAGQGQGQCHEIFDPLFGQKPLARTLIFKQYILIYRRYSRNLRVRVVIDTLIQCQRSRCFRLHGISIVADFVDTVSA